MAPIYIPSHVYKTTEALRGIILITLVLTYAVGMSRNHGVDMENYLYAFNYDYQFIPDVGFQAIIQLFNFMDLPFSLFMMMIGSVNLFALLRLARYYEISIGLLLIIWILHIVVERDFSQLRSSLAVSIAVIGITSKGNTNKLIFYFASASIHLTVAVFVLAYEACKTVSSMHSLKKQWIVILITSVLIFYFSTILPSFGIIDERVDLYMSWTKEGYGEKVSSYGPIILHVFIVSFNVFFFRVWYNDQRLRTLFYMELLGIVTFTALSEFAIFAFRLSSLIFSLYPVLILSTIKGILLVRNNGARLKSLFILYFFFLILLLRPGSSEIINKIQY